MNEATEDRHLLRFLNSVERVVIAFCRLLLWLVVAAVTAVVALVIIYRPWGDGNQGEWFYFSIAVLLVLGWAMSQFTMLTRRANNPWPEKFAPIFGNNGPGKWEFRFGSPASAASQGLSSTDDAAWRASTTFDIPLTTLEIAQPSNEVLTRLRCELERGLSLNEACQLAEPAFADWSGIEQHAYMLYIQSLLAKDSGTSEG